MPATDGACKMGSGAVAVNERAVVHSCPTLSFRNLRRLKQGVQKKMFHAYASAGRHQAIWRLALASLACIILSGAGAAVAQQPVAQSNIVPKRFFLSGHSLTDNPLAEHIAAIGKSRGVEMTWNQQIAIGSPIRARTRGDGNNPGHWSGYRLGKNKNGSTGLDILKEFSQQTNQPYDTLIVADAHKSIAGLIWNDTVRYLRHFHDRIIEHNPAARTFLFESWEGINNKSKLEPWIALERDGSKLWSCVAERINISLKHEGRIDRIETVPVGAALAELIEAIGKGDVPSLATAGKAATDEILSDDVHLAPTGRYYVALLTYVTMTGQPVEGAWRPSGVPAATALALQQLAWNFHQERKKNFRPLDMAGCRRLMTGGFCDAWNAYVPNQWMSPQPACKWYFARETTALDRNQAPNPFLFDPAIDSAYWFPPP